MGNTYNVYIVIGLKNDSTYTLTIRNQYTLNYNNKKRVDFNFNLDQV